MIEIKARDKEGLSEKSERERKEKGVGREREVNDLPSPTSRLMPSLCLSNGYLPKTPFPSVLIADRDITWHGISL